MPSVSRKGSATATPEALKNQRRPTRVRFRSAKLRAPFMIFSKASRCAAAHLHHRKGDYSCDQRFHAPIVCRSKGVGRGVEQTTVGRVQLAAERIGQEILHDCSRG